MLAHRASRRNPHIASARRVGAPGETASTLETLKRAFISSSKFPVALKPLRIRISLATLLFVGISLWIWHVTYYLHLPILRLRVTTAIEIKRLHALLPP